MELGLKTSFQFWKIISNMFWRRAAICQKSVICQSFLRTDELILFVVRWKKCIKSRRESKQTKWPDDTHATFDLPQIFCLYEIGFIYLSLAAFHRNCKMQSQSQRDDAFGVNRLNYTDYPSFILGCLEFKSPKLLVLHRDDVWMKLLSYEHLLEFLWPVLQLDHNLLQSYSLQGQNPPR